MAETSWLVVGTPPPLKNDGVSEFVSWDDEDLPTVSGKIKNMFQTTNQMILRLKEHDFTHEKMDWISTT
jgi:hypothetical protein